MLRKWYLKWLISRHSAAFKLGYDTGVATGMLKAKQNAAHKRAIDLISKIHAVTESSDTHHEKVFIDGKEVDGAVKVRAAYKIPNS